MKQKVSKLVNKQTKVLKKLVNAGVKIHTLAFNTNKFVYIASFFVIALVAVIPFISNYIAGLIVDELINNIGKDFANTLVYLVLAYLLVLVIERALGYFRSYLDSIQWIQMFNVLTLKILNVTSNFDVEHYENSKYSDLIKKARESYHHRMVNFLTRSYGVIADIISLLSGFIIIFLLSPVIVLVILVSSLPDFINDLIFGKKKYGVWDLDTAKRRDFWDTSAYLERERYLKELKIFNSKKYFFNRLKRLLINFQGRQLKVEQKRFLSGTLLTLVSGLGFGFSYLIIVNLVLKNQITVGQFTFYVASIRALSNSFSALLRNFSSLYENGLYSVDVFKLINLKPLIKSGKKPAIFTKPPVIQFKNVWFKYPNSNHYVFKNLNFTIKPGEHVAFVGENGAGKTTFVSLLTRFYDVTKGQILINGINIKNLNLQSWHKNIALLNQDFARYHLSAKDNIAIADIKKDLLKVKTSAKLSGADSFLKDLAKKYDTPLNKQYKYGTDLSTGQWQKVALARAFYKNGNVLILDEPTSAIDPKAEYEIFEKLFSFAKNKTVLIISHRFSTVRNADKIIVLSKGKIVEQGTHKQLIKNNNIYKEAYDLQKRGFEDV